MGSIKEKAEIYTLIFGSNKIINCNGTVLYRNKKGKLDEKTIIEMSVRMQELFYRRLLAYRQKPRLNHVPIDIAKLSHLW